MPSAAAAMQGSTGRAESSGSRLAARSATLKMPSHARKKRRRPWWWGGGEGPRCRGKEREHRKQLELRRSKLEQRRVARAAAALGRRDPLGFQDEALA
ncbi:hypothetical protein C2845_PM15G05150 [Panicum miliaceum]|uniref:Uncharacterized protein n=1 Tax=Panicum miliaceum TaxID=4540 RepID=A0A3L6Q834_PANMI|nr:hypothetical protein C2845_PM15G05150 [Panicum miliaceum]